MQPQWLPPLTKTKMSIFKNCQSPTLSEEEKVALIQYTVKEAAGRVPVIAGTGSNNTKASIKLTKKAEEAGADAIMLVTPYYNKPSQEGMYHHFRAIAEETSLPVMLYNVPGRTVASLAPETAIRLAEIPNIGSVSGRQGNRFRCFTHHRTGNAADDQTLHQWGGERSGLDPSEAAAADEGSFRCSKPVAFKDRSSAERS